MKFVAEFIEIFIEPFTFILGPIAVMVLIALAFGKWQSDKTKATKAKDTEMPPIQIPEQKKITDNARS